MWPFRKFSILESGILEGGTDWHCHILPGVDDGVQTMEKSLEVLDFYEQTGIREVWLTPHIMEDCPNETAALKDRFAALQAAYKGPITLHLAAENMIDTLFEARFAAGDLLTFGEMPGHAGHDVGSFDYAQDDISAGHLILVETSYFNPPMAFNQTLDEIRLRGYKPLLAHPERYVYMGPADYARLKESGVLFQLNLMSLAGLYGKAAAHNASRLLRQGMYDFFGSDLHRLSPWKHAIQEKALSKKEVAALQELRSRMDTNQ